MRASERIRQVHRWLSVVFTLAVVVNVVAMARQTQAVWVGLLALFPLVVLLLTGLYLFVLPYVVKRRRAERRERSGEAVALDGERAATER